MMKKFRGCRIICVGENGQFISIGIINSEYPEYTEGREYGSDMQAMSAKLKEVNAETLKEFEKQSRIHKDIEQCFVKQIEWEYSKIVSNKKSERDEYDPYHEGIKGNKQPI